MVRPEVGRTVLEIQPKPFSQPFTDYLDFTLSFAELTQLVTSQSPRDEWCRMLSATAGVYLILDQSSGKQYIGSASGTEDIWGRWKDYVATRGHGGNVELVKTPGGQRTARPVFSIHGPDDPTQNHDPARSH